MSLLLAKQGHDLLMICLAHLQVALLLGRLEQLLIIDNSRLLAPSPTSCSGHRGGLVVRGQAATMCGIFRTVKRGKLGPGVNRHPTCDNHGLEWILQFLLLFPLLNQEVKLLLLFNMSGEQSIVYRIRAPFRLLDLSRGQVCFLLQFVGLFVILLIG